jgi:hypothetical protein
MFSTSYGKGLRKALERNCTSIGRSCFVHCFCHVHQSGEHRLSIERFPRSFQENNETFCRKRKKFPKTDESFPFSGKLSATAFAKRVWTRFFKNGTKADIPGLKNEKRRTSVRPTVHVRPSSLTARLSRRPDGRTDGSRRKAMAKRPADSHLPSAP